MTFSAVLLAGGASRRMGADKATMVFRGQPLWQRQIDLLRELSPEKILVSAREEPAWLPIGIESLLDERPSRGPLSGLTKALEQMQTTHLVALAVDMPFMTSDQMDVVRELAAEGRGVVPIIGERAEPLAAIYPAEAAMEFAAALAGSDFSLQGVIRKLVAEEKVRLSAVPAQDEHFYRSMNELGSLKEGRFSNRPPN